jgi:hypothetical protein
MKRFESGGEPQEKFNGNKISLDSCSMPSKDGTIFIDLRSGSILKWGARLYFLIKVISTA